MKTIKSQQFLQKQAMALSAFEGYKPSNNQAALINRYYSGKIAEKDYIDTCRKQAKR